MNTAIIILSCVYVIGLACLLFKLWMDARLQKMDEEDRKFEKEVSWL